MHALGRSSEIELFGHGNEMSQMAELDHLISVFATPSAQPYAARLNPESTATGEDFVPLQLLHASRQKTT
jgi:hypothetical protein